VFQGLVEGPGPAAGERAVATSFGARWHVCAADSSGTRISLGVRPESLTLEPGGNGGESWNSLTGTVTEAAYLGAVVRYRMRVGDGLMITADIHNPDFAAIRSVGDELTVWFAASRA